MTLQIPICYSKVGKQIEFKIINLIMLGVLFARWFAKIIWWCGMYVSECYFHSTLWYGFEKKVQSELFTLTGTVVYSNHLLGFISLSQLSRMRGTAILLVLSALVSTCLTYFSYEGWVFKFSNQSKSGFGKKLIFY